MLASALAAATGVLIVVWTGVAALAVVGIVLWGFGAALGFPVGMSAAGDDPARAARRVSVVSTIGYGAFLAGPPLLGFVGDHVGTLDSLLVIAIAMVPAAVLVSSVRKPERGRSDPANAGAERRSERRRPLAAEAASMRHLTGRIPGRPPHVGLGPHHGRTTRRVPSGRPPHVGLEPHHRRTTRDRQEVCNGNRESLREVLGRDSIVVWQCTSFRRKRGEMRAWAAAASGPRVIRLRRPAQARAFVAAETARRRNVPQTEAGPAT